MQQVSAEVIRLHLDYSAWASARLLDASAQLSSEDLNRDFETADRTILGTMVHVFAADRIWLGRIERHLPATFVSPEDHDFERLQTAWPALHERWKSWAAGLTDEAAAESCSYRDLKGNTHSSVMWQIILHVVNHATHHRGQAAGFIRTLNRKPPTLDLIAYYRERIASEARP